MTLYDWLKLAHILAAMVWLGGGLMLVFVARRARASGSPAAIVDFGRSLSYLGPRVLAPAVIAVFVFGVWMVLDSAAWDFSQTWVLLALALFALAFLVGAIYLSRVSVQLARQAEADREAGRSLLDRWLIGYAVVLAILVVTVWDMVFKPGM
jgi:uncharacterized membrane protein